MASNKGGKRVNATVTFSAAITQADFHKVAVAATKEDPPPPPPEDPAAVRK